MVNNDYATKADLKVLRDELKGDMTVLRDELTVAIHASERTLRDELTEVMRDIETKLLKAFYGFAESTQQRLAQHDGFNERLAIIERRLTDLEKHVHSPPAS